MRSQPQAKLNVLVGRIDSAMKGIQDLMGKVIKMVDANDAKTKKSTKVVKKKSKKK